MALLPVNSPVCTGIALPFLGIRAYKLPPPPINIQHYCLIYGYKHKTVFGCPKINRNGSVQTHAPITGREETRSGGASLLGITWETPHTFQTHFINQ